MALILLLAGCGDREWSHPCDPDHGDLVPVTIDMIAIDTDCLVSTETGLLEVPGRYVFCGKHKSNGWCAAFLDFKIDSNYCRNGDSDEHDAPPDRILEVTLEISIAWKGGGTIDVLPWREPDSIPSPFDIEVADVPWWTLGTFSNGGVVPERITLTLQAPVVDWMLNGSSVSLTGIILYPRNCSENPDSDEGYWIIDTIQVPHLQILAVWEK